jgi:cell division transport system permease protein
VTARVKLLLSEAVRSLGANVSTTVAATMTVLIGMFLLGFLIGLATWAVSLGGHYKRQLEVKVFFNQDATPSQINVVREKLEADPRVKLPIDFVSAREGLALMKKRNPDLFKGADLPTNPLGPAFTVLPKRAEDVTSLNTSLGACPPDCLPGVHKVDNGKKIATRLLTVAHVIEGFFVAAVIVLLISSTLLIGNTIRLAIFARRREIEVMKLVGASNWFVRGPFILEGIATGLVGSVVAVALLVVGKELALPQILPRFEAGPGVQAWPFPVVSAILVALGLALGATGSALTLRRFLRI